MENTNFNQPLPSQNEANVTEPVEDSEEEESSPEDLAIEAHERLNALIAVLLKKGTFTEEELEFEAFKQEQEED